MAIKRPFTLPAPRLAACGVGVGVWVGQSSRPPVTLAPAPPGAPRASHRERPRWEQK